MKKIPLISISMMVFFSFFVHAEIENHQYKVIESFETDDCLITFLQDESGTSFVLKQIKNPIPDEQFLLVLDATGCSIANQANIPMNHIEIIPAHTPFPGKTYVDLPATLHTFAKGVSMDKDNPYSGLSIHQRFRKENSPRWKKWGPLPPESTGLTIDVIKNMARHPDLPSIAALDTFVGNADRSAPNLYYDEETDKFCGIDMAASFNTLLAKEACRQIQTLEDVLTSEEKRALKEYGKILELLIKKYPPSVIENQLLQFVNIAGFYEGSLLLDQDVLDRKSYHKRQIRENYSDCLKLVLLIQDCIDD